MNLNRSLSLLCVLLLFVAGRTVGAQTEPPKEKTATAATAPEEVKLDEKEIDKIARSLNEYETTMAKAKIKNSPKLHARAIKVWDQLQEYLGKIAAGGRDPLKAVTSWWQVFSSEKYHKCEGRNGKRNGQKFLWQWMGKQLPVVYNLWVSSEYRPREPNSMALCLHPRKGKFSGTDYLRQLWSTKELQAAATILVAPEFPEGQPPEAHWSDRNLLYATLGMMGSEVLRSQYNVDYNRWFLDGYLDGATDAWRLASQFGDIFAGVIIRGGAPPEETRFEDFRNVAFLLIGIPETALDPGQAEALGARMKAAGIDVTVANLAEAPQPRKERDAFKDVEETIQGFLDKRRDPYPEKIDWSVKKNHTRRCFYVNSTNEVEDETIKDAAARKKPPSFQVSIDRTGNKLVITAHRVLGLEISLNDRILDLDREVTFEVNGKVLFNGKADRSFRHLYDSFEASGDWTRVFPWSREIEVPWEEPAAKPAQPAPKAGDKPAEAKPKPAAPPESAEPKAPEGKEPAPSAKKKGK